MQTQSLSPVFSAQNTGCPSESTTEMLHILGRVSNVRGETLTVILAFVKMQNKRLKPQINYDTAQNTKIS